MGEWLSSMYEALGLTSCNNYTSTQEVQAGGTGVGSHLPLHRKFEVILNSSSPPPKRVTKMYGMTKMVGMGLIPVYTSRICRHTYTYPISV